MAINTGIGKHILKSLPLPMTRGHAVVVCRLVEVLLAADPTSLGTGVRKGMVDLHYLQATMEAADVEGRGIVQTAIDALLVACPHTALTVTGQLAANVQLRRLDLLGSLGTITHLEEDHRLVQDYVVWQGDEQPGPVAVERVMLGVRPDLDWPGLFLGVLRVAAERCRGGKGEGGDGRQEVGQHEGKKKGRKPKKRQAEGQRKGGQPKGEDEGMAEEGTQRNVRETRKGMGHELARRLLDAGGLRLVYQALKSRKLVWVMPALDLLAAMGNALGSEQAHMTEAFMAGRGLDLLADVWQWEETNIRLQMAIAKVLLSLAANSSQVQVRHHERYLLRPAEKDD